MTAPGPDSGTSERSLSRDLRPLLLAGLGALCGLAVGAFSLRGIFEADPRIEDLLDDPALREELVRELALTSPGYFDSHPDPVVARVLQPNLSTRGAHDVEVTTNAYGMREGAYAMPKPEGVVRVVLLGDSYVFGWRVKAEERVGEHLRRMLGERARPGSRIECLHLAVSSWNLEAECAFVLRQLEELDPDLVVHVTIENDLDDSVGVRGVGLMATMVPARPERADGFLASSFPSLRLSISRQNLLSSGLDWESQQRYQSAAAAIARLREALARRRPEARYLMLVRWSAMTTSFHRWIGADLPEDQVLYVPQDVVMDPARWIDAYDEHWSPRMHAEVASWLYGWIRAQGWLDSLELALWPAAEAEALRIARAGRAEAVRAVEDVWALYLDKLASALDLTALTPLAATQIHGGVDGSGLVSPYASILLARRAGTTLRVSGRALGDALLSGSLVRVSLDDLEIGSIELQPDSPIEFSAPIPPALDGRAHLSVRFESEDFVYRGEDLRRCVVFRLDRVALEP